MTEEKIAYRSLGKSGMKVFPLCLGTMSFGTQWKGMMGIGSENSDVEKIFKSYIDVGGNYIDTANAYQNGDSEKIVAEMIKKFDVPRDNLVIATKYTMPMDPKDPNHVGNHKKNMKRSLEGSLKRLNTDYIDLYYTHYWEWTSGSDFVMRGLNELVRSGKVLHIGISDCPAWIVSKMNQLAKDFALEPFIVYQGEYSLIERSIDQEIGPMCKDFNMSICPWGAVGQGVLAGKRKKEDMKRGMAQAKFVDGVDKIQDKVVEIAANHNVSAAQVSMNWCLSRPCVDSILIGPRTYAHFEDALGVLKFELTEQELKELDEVSANFPSHIFPSKYIGTSYKTNNWIHAFGNNSYFFDKQD